MSHAVPPASAAVARRWQVEPPDSRRLSYKETRSTVQETGGNAVSASAARS